jgi:hypothetical protein
MSRRIAVRACTLCLLIGTAEILSPMAASASDGWTTLARHCYTFQYNGDRVRACTSIKGGVVEGRLMIRTKCRVKMLTFEPDVIWLNICILEKGFDLETVSSVPETTRSGLTGLIVKTPLVECAPDFYSGYMDFAFPYPDGTFGSYGLGVEWPEWPNKTDCSLLT